MIPAFTETLSKTAYAAGTRGTDGRYVNGATTVTSITASVQPASGRDVETLTEGERQRDPKRIYTETELKPADPNTEKRADTLVIDGSTYEVRSVKRERYLFLHHYKAIALRLQEGTSA